MLTLENVTVALVLNVVMKQSNLGLFCDSFLYSMPHSVNFDLCTFELGYVAQQLKRLKNTSLPYFLEDQKISTRNNL